MERRARAVDWPAMAKPKPPEVLDSCPCCLRPWTREEQQRATTGVLQVQPDGAWRVRGPLADTIAPHRVRLILAVLEAAAVLKGDRQAAAVYLEHIRWRAEMKKGKPPARTEVAVSGRVVVVNDLGELASGNGAYVNRPALPGRTIDVDPIEG